MADPNLPPSPSGGDPLYTLTGIEPVFVCIGPDHDVNAVELRIADDRGHGFAVLFGPEAAGDVIARLTVALSALTGRGDVERIGEAQRLVGVLKEAVGWRQREIARRVGVTDLVLSLWLSGKMAPPLERVEQLRAIVRGALRCL